MMREWLSRSRTNVADVLRAIGPTSLLLSTVILLVAGGVYFYLSGLIDPRLYEFSSVDVWFEADVARVTENMTDRWADHHRSKVHPLWSFLTVPPTYFVIHFLGATPHAAVRIVMAIWTGVAFSSLFLIIRSLGCRLLDSIAVVAVTGVTAAALFGFTVPETHSLGFLSVLPAIALAVKGKAENSSYELDVAASASSLSVTTTNWMYGLVAVFLRRRRRDAAIVTLAALGAVTILWAVQRRLIPSVVFFLGNPVETAHVLAAEARGAVNVIQSFFLYTGVMPSFDVVDRRGAGEWPIMITQSVTPSDASVPGAVAMYSWVALLGCGVWTLLNSGDRWKVLKWFITATLLGQLGLFIIFGSETFFYALNFLPLFAIIIAFSCLGSLRRPVLLLLGVFLFSATWNNATRFVEATGFFDRFARYHSGSFEMIQADSINGSTKGRDFSVLWSSGIREFDWGYLVDGIHFSPGINTFGVTIEPTPDSRSEAPNPAYEDLGSVRQVMERDDRGRFRFVEMFDDRMRLEWRAVGRRSWKVTFEPADTTLSSSATALRVRPTGPNGGPIRRLSIRDGRLRINGRWIVAPQRSVVAIRVGCRGRPLEELSGVSEAEVVSAAGIAQAELVFEGSDEVVVAIYDEEPEGPVDRFIEPLPAGCNVSANQSVGSRSRSDGGLR